MVLFKKIKQLFVKDETGVLFYELFGFYPNNIELYKLSLIHKSHSIKTANGLLNNERLEYLGDAILTSIVSGILYKYFPTKSEGFLTKIRSKIVSRDSLNILANKIGLEKFILKKTDEHHVNVKGDAFEALIAAIYLDKGYSFCYNFIEEKIILKYIDIKKLVVEDHDYKSKIIEWGQQNKKNIKFSTNTITKDNTQFFKTRILLNNIEIATGIGKSKKESHQNAARLGVYYLEDISEIK